MGQKHPMGNRLTDVQKCIRTKPEEVRVRRQKCLTEVQKPVLPKFDQ